MKKLYFNFKEVPHQWALCFNGNCPLKDQCLRFAAGEKVPGDWTTGMSVLPNAYQSGTCKMFKPIKTEMMAWGFSHLYNKVRHDHYTRLRNEVESYLGKNSNYFRYNRGEYKLSVEQQEHIARIFNRYGYQDAPVFDHYEEELMFQ